MKLVNFIRGIDKKEIIILLFFLLESVAIIEINFGNNVVIDTDFNFPLNREGSLRWIYNNLDGYTFDVRNINRFFIGTIFYILYSIYNNPFIFKYFMIAILFLSLLTTYYVIKNICNIIFCYQNIIFQIIISQLIIINNFTIQTRFTALSALIFLYLYIPLSLYLTIKYINFNRKIYIFYLFLLNLITPITEPIYFIIWFFFLLIYIIPFIRLHFRNLIILFFGFLPTFIFLTIQAVFVSTITSPYLSTAYSALQQNTPSMIQFFAGIDYPIAFEKYCISNSNCYFYNYFARYYLNNYITSIIYLLKIVIFVIPFLIVNYKIENKNNTNYLYYFSIYLVLILIITSPQLFIYSKVVALAFRFPYHRFAFPLIITEITLFLYLAKLKKYIRKIVVIYLIILYVVYYLPLWSGMLFINSPMENFKIPINILEPLISDIRFISNFNKTILYLPYSTSSYSVCFILNNSIVYNFLNPFYLFSDANIIYNSNYISTNYNNNLTQFILHNYNNIIIVVEKHPCLYNSTLTIFDNRIFLKPDDFLRFLNHKYTIYNLTNYYVISFANT